MQLPACPSIKNVGNNPGLAGAAPVALSPVEITAVFFSHEAHQVPRDHSPHHYVKITRPVLLIERFHKDAHRLAHTFGL